MDDPQAASGRCRRGPSTSPRSPGLVETAIEFARSLDGLTHVHLAVAESGQAAQALYEHLGFRTWGTEPAAIRVGEVSVAEHHMVRALGPGAA
jgi:catechol-2,3-dioxygenase